MSDMTPSTVITALASIPELVSRQDKLATDGPGVDSAAFRASRTKLGRHAWDLSVAALSAATDHLTALDGLIGADDRPAWAYFTLMRSAIESACLARWLCDPRIRPSRRLGRGVAAQIADYRERAKVEKFIDPPLKVPVTSLISNLEVAYARLHYGSLPTVPTTTKLVNDFAVPRANGELIFRLLSGAAHGKQWVMLPMSQFTASAVAGPRRSSHVAAITVSPKLVAIFSVITVRAVARAISDAEQYGGPRPTTSS